MNKEEVLKLAKLARIEIADSEAESLTHEFESIIKYVSEVKEVHTTNSSQPTTESHPIRNVLRDDENAHESGIYTEALLEGAPKRDGNYISVKKIL